MTIEALQERSDKAGELVDAQPQTAIGLYREVLAAGVRHGRGCELHAIRSATVT